MSGIREEFEKEYDWPSLDDRQRLIVDGSCWSVWQKAWQASRAALKVELPDRKQFVEYYEGLEGGKFNWRKYLTAVTEALQQAGIEVK